MCYAFAIAYGAYIYDAHLEGMWGWGLEICDVFVDSIEYFWIAVLMLIFVDMGWGVTQPETLSWAKDQSCEIQSPDWHLPLENRTLSLRIHEQDA